MNENLKSVLLLSKIVDNKLYLPDIQLDRKDYLALSKELTALGGAWKGGKISAFVFNFDPQLILDRLLSDNNTNIKKSTQFFPTPNKIVKQMFELVSINKDDTILEPSAGQGAIIEELLKLNNNPIAFCETEEININILKEKFGNTIKQIGTNFLDVENCFFNKIIANPPFSKHQDITHIKHMFSLLDLNGSLVSLSGTSWKHNSDKKSVDFRNWLKTKDHQVIDISAGEFSSSGTQIATCIILINN